MIFELAFGVGAGIAAIAFLAEYVDSTLGMGYGTALTPLLLLMGFEPLQVVPAVLLSELVTGLLAGFTHHSVGNVDFRPRTMNARRIARAIRELGVAESFRRGIPLHLKLVLVIASCSVLGTLAAVFIAISLPKFYLKLYIGLLVLAIGVVILSTLNKRYDFSWKKVTFLGLVASFNKGISGGGYGPVVTGGQLLSGVDDKNAIGITSLAEGLTCCVGIAAYVMMEKMTDLVLAPYLIIGAVISVPLSAITVRKMKTARLRLGIGILTIILGVTTLWKIVLK
jgi:uncharacterized membrane protein YfcA